MKLVDLLDLLNSTLSAANFEDFCPNGLQVEGNPEVQKVATAVTASEATIRAAVEMGVDALVVHHGIFWKGDPYPIVGPLKRRIEPLFSAGISLLAYHLPLDAHTDFGNNWPAARDLGLSNLLPFGKIGEVSIGVSGEVGALSREAWQEKIEAYYDHPAAAALGGPSEVDRVAILSGGGYRLIPEAARAGIRTFVTGNFDEPAWALSHEWGVNFFALGHAATERVGPRKLAEFIGQKVSCSFLNDDNPF